uniref:MAPK regulated corepressor interacting protein 2 isoform X3 n=1 Tax=Ictidomys tridecemlineatus TaxID=43179 RepID=UPI001A9FC238|nr:MAPK regulated corepressor interacting protein 2 isoform X3 [Ictidomys tridecemlineatus]
MQIRRQPSFEPWPWKPSQPCALGCRWERSRSGSLVGVALVRQGLAWGLSHRSRRTPPGGRKDRRPRSALQHRITTRCPTAGSAASETCQSGPPQQQVESRLGELLKCRQPAPPASPPPRAQPLAPQPGPWPLSSPGPRLVFNRVNGRRPLTTSPSLERTQETYTLAHEENVRFVSEDFVPIDLDEWWAQQFLARITSCS